MKNAHVLRMAMALLTPAEESVSEDTSADDTVTDDGSDSDSGSENGPGSLPGATPTMLALTDGATSMAVTTVKVAVNDPMVADRLRLLLDTAVGMLYGKALLADRTLPRPSYPLCADEEFPLPDALASVTACYAAWLFTGEERMKIAWQGGLDGYLSTLEAVIEPIGKRR